MACRGFLTGLSFLFYLGKVEDILPLPDELLKALGGLLDRDLGGFGHRALPDHLVEFRGGEAVAGGAVVVFSADRVGEAEEVDAVFGVVAFRHIAGGFGRDDVFSFSHWESSFLMGISCLYYTAKRGKKQLQGSEGER